MPKNAIKSYEDWTPPKFLQGEGDEIDLERIKLEFYTRESENAQYRRSNRSLKEQVADLRSQVSEGDDDSSDDSEDDASERRPKEKKNEGEGQGPSLTEARLKIALEKGLTYNQAMRLHGSTAEELEADAVVYMEEHGIKSRSDEENDDEADEEDKASSESTEPPRRMPRRGDGKSGSERGDDGEPSYYDPAKFVGLV